MCTAAIYRSLCNRSSTKRYIYLISNQDILYFESVYCCISYTVYHTRSVDEKSLTAEPRVSIHTSYCSWSKTRSIRPIHVFAIRRLGLLLSPCVFSHSRRCTVVPDTRTRARTRARPPARPYLLCNACTVHVYMICLKKCNRTTKQGRV